MTALDKLRAKVDEVRLLHARGRCLPEECCTCDEAWPCDAIQGWDAALMLAEACAAISEDCSMCSTGALEAIESAAEVAG